MIYIYNTTSRWIKGKWRQDNISNVCFQFTEFQNRKASYDCNHEIIIHVLCCHVWMNNCFTVVSLHHHEMIERRLKKCEHSINDSESYRLDRHWRCDIHFIIEIGASNGQQFHQLQQILSRIEVRVTVLDATFNNLSVI